MKIILFILLLLATTFGSAQNKGIVKGKIIDTIGKQNLQNGSISLLNVIDSTLEHFTLAKPDGSFEFKNINLETYILQISFQGYANVFKKIALSSQNALVFLDNIYLSLQSKDLGTVVVKQAPIAITNDTVQYNAGSFKTKPNAVVEDLLKKLPGIQVDKDGTIKAQGEVVQRVLVDGKQFFGDDPKMATRNLPPEIVDKIQVFDGLSDQAAFSGFDDGNKTKTINIVTKKDKRKGTFGRATLGIGSNANKILMDNNLSISKFNGPQQTTITFQANDVNKQNFSVQDILGSLGNGNIKGMGGGGGKGGAGGVMTSLVQSIIGSGSNNGIVNTISGGINFRDAIGKKTEMYGSYFYNSQITNKNLNSYTQNFVSKSADSSTFNNQLQNSITNNKNHRINFNVEHNFDSSSSIVFRPNFSFQNTNSFSQQNTAINFNKISNLLNSNGTNNKINEGFTGNFEVTYRHKFKKKGRTISLNSSLAATNNTGNGGNLSVNSSFSNNTIYRNDTINQIFNSIGESTTTNTTFSYTEPLSKNQQIEIAFTMNNQKSSNQKSTFGYDSATNFYSKNIANLTNNFSNIYNSSRLNVSYRYATSKLNLVVGSGLQWGKLQSINNSTNFELQQHYTNFFPTANFNYSFSKTQSFRFNYRGRTSQPTVQQLQPIIDNSNALNIVQGNPSLQQQFSHNINMFYNSFNIFTQKLIFATVNFSMIDNDIQNSILQLPNGVQISKPVNLSGTYNILGYFNYGFPLRKPKSNLNFGINTNFNQSQSLLNNQSNFTSNTTIGGNIIWTTNLKDKWDINFTSNTTLNYATYSLQPLQNNNYYAQFFSLEATYFTKKGWIINADFDYTFNGGRADIYNTTIPLLGVSIAKQLFKNKAGEIKLFMFDVLGLNKSISRNIASNYIQDINTQVLNRYVMLSFTYNLKKFGGKNMPPFGKMFRGNRGGRDFGE
jgi:Outer membrane protein beta-barrel family